MNHERFDIVVVGSGIAGLTYALSVAEGNPSLRIALATKKESRESNTNYAQGGIAAALSKVDSFESHVADTLGAGAGLCDESQVREIVRRGPTAVRRLAERGVRFTRRDGEFDLVMEGGHSARRVAHTFDHTGQEIERALVANIAATPAISTFENDIVVDLRVDRSGPAPQVCGAVVFDARRGEFVRFDARIVMLATGGVGQVYRHTTNPLIATGDGVAIAFRAGASVANMEFVQFHPTAFYETDAAGDAGALVSAGRTLLISEAVRGEGARLVNLAGHAFMPDYDPRGALAPRDIVARAIGSELTRRDETHVLLDLSPIPVEVIRERFPNILRACLERGVDITRDPIPVAPSAHYLCGGVRASIEGVTDIAGLLVAGEVAHTGMHGANRLASNSLLEAVVMAEAAAGWTLANIGSFANSPSRADRGAGPGLSEAPGTAGGSVDISLGVERARLKELMSRHVGIVRSAAGLAIVRAALNDMVARVGGAVSPNQPDPYASIELRNMTQVAGLIIDMATDRTESRGLHHRSDFPTLNDRRWRRDSVIFPQL